MEEGHIQSLASDARFATERFCSQLGGALEGLPHPRAPKVIEDVPRCGATKLSRIVQSKAGDRGGLYV